MRQEGKLVSSEAWDWRVSQGPKRWMGEMSDCCPDGWFQRRTDRLLMVQLVLSNRGGWSMERADWIRWEQ